MKRFLLIPAFITTLLLSCSIFSSAPAAERGNVKNVVSDDAAMNAAIQRAQDTLPLFIKALQSPKPTQTYFSVKVRFPYDNAGSGEHMWLDDLSFAENQFEGVLANEPVYVHSLHMGDHVTVDISDVTDWMIIEDDHLLGGFTIHVLRNQMTERERQQFDDQFGISIPDEPALP